MIISQRFNFAFIHNPKVAGTSVRSAIQAYHDWPERYWHQMYTTGEDRVVDNAHITYSRIDDEAKEALAKCFVFGFVRDPLSRFFSSLAEFRRQHSDLPQARMETNQFIQTCLTKANIRFGWEYIHFCPQDAFFYEGNKCRADFIGRHESFLDDWESVQRLLGIKFDPLNNSRRREKAPEEELTEESMVVLRHLYTRDCLLFGYDSLIEQEPPLDTHMQRIEMIHVPYKNAGDISKFSPGEKIAWLEKRVEYYERFLK